MWPCTGNMQAYNTKDEHAYLTIRHKIPHVINLKKSSSKVDNIILGEKKS